MFLQNLIILTTIFLLIYIAWDDFKNLRVANKSVLLLISVYLFDRLISGSAIPLSDLLAALTLFVVGLLLWLFHTIGAGDAKLFFPVGLLIGQEELLNYSVSLCLFSVGLFVLMKWPIPMTVSGHGFTQRMAQLRKGKHAPFAVAISFATIFVLISQMINK